MSNGDVVGQVTPYTARWYVLDDDRVVSVHIAYTSAERDEWTTFMVPSDTFASVEAIRLGIPFHFIRNAEVSETMDFFNSLTDVRVMKTLNIE